MRPLAYDNDYAFNAICPYYTMFPLEYPLAILRKFVRHSPLVIDPFCGRGTTVYAARKLGLKCYGVDSSPIAAAIAKAKLASATGDEVIALAEELLANKPKFLPESEFFTRCYEESTLREICSIREGLFAADDETDASAILRAVMLGCLHGPLLQGRAASYFSNQMPRTFASKPDYSVRFWRDRKLKPPRVRVLDVVRRKLDRITDLDSAVLGSTSNVRCSDSRKATSFRGVTGASLTITSPPYYGMRTYVQDQWLRSWFLGGAETVDYNSSPQLCHSGHDSFVADLAKVWQNVGRHSADGAHLFVRFGTLPSAKSDAKDILRRSLTEASGWELVSTRRADTARAGKRQADQMGRDSKPAEEYDFHAVKV